MNRRGFLSGLGALIGGIALQEAIPLGRVWSFPKEVKCLNTVLLPSLAGYPVVYYDRMMLGILEKNFIFFPSLEIKRSMIQGEIGRLINMRIDESNVARTHLG